MEEELLRGACFFSLAFMSYLHEAIDSLSALARNPLRKLITSQLMTFVKLLNPASSSVCFARPLPPPPSFHLLGVQVKQQHSPLIHQTHFSTLIYALTTSDSFRFDRY